MTILKLESAREESRVAVVRVQGNYHLVATGLIQPGEFIMLIQGELTNQPSRFTVQIDRGVHIDVPVDAGLERRLDHYRWCFLNHSCDPSTVIRGREVFARRRIKAWDELTFDYDSTEYNMAEPFPCRCGSPRCRGVIRGYRHLTTLQRRRLQPYVAHFLPNGQDSDSTTPAIETPA